MRELAAGSGHRVVSVASCRVRTVGRLADGCVFMQVVAGCLRRGVVVRARISGRRGQRSRCDEPDHEQGA